MLGEKKRDENVRFRKFMTTRDYSDRILRRTAEEVEDAIDCTVCANCCREATTEVSERDIERLAKHFRVPAARVVADYTQPGEQGQRNLKWQKGPGCVFLDGTLCSVYESRPDICQRYPHLVRGNGSIASRMWSMPDRATICPIVYNTLEEFKEELKFRK